MQSGHVVAEAECGPPPVRTTSKCDEPIGTRAEAIRALNLQPVCTDEAIALLRGQAERNANALNDLAGAYYVRAQRDDNPLDLIAAFEAIEKAPPSTDTQFNRALILEALGLRRDALSLWEHLSAGGSGEARDHVERLKREEERSAAKRWERAQRRLGPALARGDVAEVRRLIAPFPIAAEVSFFGSRNPTLAEALGQITGDSFDRDYLTQPLAADIMRRFGDSSKLPPAQAIALIDSIDRDARARGYRHIEAFVHLFRGLYVGFQSRYLDSLAEYDAAQAEFSRIGDAENIAVAHLRRVGVLRAFGDSVGSWREALATIHNDGVIANALERAKLYNEAAATILELNHPRLAGLYTNFALTSLQEGLGRASPSDLRTIKGLQANIASTRRNRANIEVRLGDYAAAENDLAEAVRLAKLQSEEIQRLLYARIDEARGESLLHTNPTASAAAFDDALQKATPEFLTFRASLLAQRGEALRRLGRTADSNADLLKAVDLLQTEEARALLERRRGQGEDYWRPYFARFDDAYRRLIAQFVALGDASDAFRYAERQRAVEVLDLVQQLGIEPADLKGDIDLVHLQQTLPTGTLILEYAFAGDQTIVWLISGDTFKPVLLPVSRNDIEHRVATLRELAEAHDKLRTDTVAYTLYSLLLTKPLRAFGRMPDRLVIVPDGALHTLPFAALRDPVTRDHLIEQTTLETAGSAKLYLLSLKRDRALPRNPHVLVMGDPAFERDFWLTKGLNRLPAAKREAQALNELYSGYAQTLLEENATIAQFRDAAPSCGVIHIAGHAIVNARMPSQSFLVLAPSGSDHGTLDTQQLLSNGKTLAQTRLVVLSACSSAGGLPIGPEGVAPLVRPLIGAGVPAVIGSVWNVDDATTERLLVSFHHAYRAGNDAAAALRIAQLELLHGAKTGLRPVAAWAPFQVIGHASSPFAAPMKTPKEKPP